MGERDVRDQSDRINELNGWNQKKTTDDERSAVKLCRLDLKCVAACVLKAEGIGWVGWSTHSRILESVQDEYVYIVVLISVDYFLSYWLSADRLIAHLKGCDSYVFIS